MPDTLRQLLAFGVAGVAGLVADIALLYLALALGCGPYAGRALSFVGAVWVTWRLNRRFAFAAATRATWGEWWRYLSAMLGGGAVNLAVYTLIMLAAPRTSWLPMAAVACGSLAGMGVNFLGAKLLVFRA